MHILVNSHVTPFQVCPQTTFLVTWMYTKIHSHKHIIIQLSWIHLVHTCSIWTFSVMIVSILPHILASFWANQKIVFHHYSFHTLTSSVLMLFQNIWNILGISLHICCPTSQKYMFTLTCRNVRIKSNWCTLALWLESSAGKYFRVLVDAFVDQVYPIM